MILKTAQGEGLRFGLVGDVPPAARDPYPCSGVNFPKKGTHVLGFFRKKVPIFSAFYKIFRDLHSEPWKILKIRPNQVFFNEKWDPCLGISFKKPTQNCGTSPYVLKCQYPLPPEKNALEMCY